MQDGGHALEQKTRKRIRSLMGRGNSDGLELRLFMFMLIDRR